ncbi:hypothetical protein [Saccharopolyspora rosea]|uniref:hypothetical protein n=1 Tax=Saccharopolyspora rosea TaxID=524884 RepID=UPI0021DB7F86|nr:hypothetical protein [Saccharopolyspora rosea]
MPDANLVSKISERLPAPNLDWIYRSAASAGFLLALVASIKGYRGGLLESTSRLLGWLGIRSRVPVDSIVAWMESREEVFSALVLAVLLILFAVYLAGRAHAPWYGANRTPSTFLICASFLEQLYGTVGLASAFSALIMVAIARFHLTKRFPDMITGNDELQIVLIDIIVAAVFAPLVPILWSVSQATPGEQA